MSENVSPAKTEKFSSKQRGPKKCEEVIVNNLETIDLRASIIGSIFDGPDFGFKL